MKSVTGMRLLAHCACGCTNGSEIVALCSPPNPVEDLRQAISKFLDERGNVRFCTACGRSLLDPNTKLYLVYRREEAH